MATEIDLEYQSEKGAMISIITLLCLMMLIVYMTGRTHYKNICTSIIAFICCAVITVSIIAIMFAKKYWDFGIIESIFMVATIGMSVQNTGLLAYSYSCSYEPSRTEKMNQAYREMGAVVLHSSVTQFVCALFLIISVQKSFRSIFKFSIVVMTIVSFSFIVSMFLFGSL